MTENESRQPSQADMIAAQNEYNNHVWHICLWPRQWQTCDPGLNLPWQSVELNDNQRSEVPRYAGVYSLVVQPGIAGHPACSYLMYLGKAKDLRKRFNDYLTTERTKRSKVARLLHMYHDYIRFFYSGIDGTELDSTEEQLFNAFVPPCNSQFTGYVKEAKGAF